MIIVICRIEKGYNKPKLSSSLHIVNFFVNFDVKSKVTVQYRTTPRNPFDGGGGQGVAFAYYPKEI